MRVHKEVEHISKTLQMPTVQDVVKVSRVRVNRVVTQVPEIREEGDLLIVPVVEEEILLQKRLVLREEIHIRRQRVEGHVAKTVSLAREHATVDRLDSQGNVIAKSTSAAARPARSPAPRQRVARDGMSNHKSILD